jgi:ribosomal protein S8
MNKILVYFLIQLRNASLNKKQKISIKNMQNFSVYAEILYKKGLIQSFTFKGNLLIIYLRIFGERVMTENLKLLSTPSKVKSLSYLDLLQANLKCKYYFLSTPQGLMSHKECLKKKIGGIAIFSC